MSQVQSTPLEEGFLWIFAYGRIEWTECANLFRQWRRRTRLPDGLCIIYFFWTTSSILNDAQGHVIEVHGTRTAHMRLRLQGQSVCADFSVANVKSPILSMEKVVKQGDKFEAGPTRCKRSRGNRSVTLDVVKNSLWVDATAYTTAEGALNADARFGAPVVHELPEETLKRSRDIRAPEWSTKIHM